MAASKATLVQLKNDVLPSKKICLPRKASGAMSVTNSPTEVSKMPTTTPASKSTMGRVAPRASVKVSATPTKAPAKAAPDRPRRSSPSAVAKPMCCCSKPPAASTSTTPRPAPAAEPSRYGSARGLRNRPWAKAPARPSKAPVNSAPTVRGARMSRTSSHSWAQPQDQPSLPAAKPSTVSKPASVVRTQPSDHAEMRQGASRTTGEGEVKDTAWSTLSAGGRRGARQTHQAVGQNLGSLCQAWAGAHQRVPARSIKAAVALLAQCVQR